MNLVKPRVVVPIAFALLAALSIILAYKSRHGNAAWIDLTSKIKYVGNGIYDMPWLPNEFPGIWLNNHELMLPGVGDYSPKPKPFTVVDVDSGARHTLPGAPPEVNADETAVSPNGKWVLWFRYPGSAASVTDIQSGAAVKLTAMLFRPAAAWLPDSRHWAMPEYGAIGVNDVVTGANRRIPVPGVTGLEHSARLSRSGSLVLTGTYDSFAAGFVNRVVIGAVNMNDAHPRLIESAVPAPTDPGSSLGHFIISPDAAHILWVYDRFEYPLMSWMAMKIMHRPYGTPTHYDELYLTNIDGTGVRQIGRLRDEDFRWPVAWSPDGTRLAADIDEKVAVIDLQ